MCSGLAVSSEIPGSIDAMSAATRSRKGTAPVVLLWGEDAFLLREEALAKVAGRRLTEVEAADWQGGELQDLATPSLFGEARALLVSDAKNLTKDALAELARYVAAPDPEAPLVLSAQVGERAKAPAALERLIRPVGEVREVKVARKDLESWLIQRAQARGVGLAPPAAHALVETIGDEPGGLAAALDQLASAFPGEKITQQLVARQFRGLGDQKTWDLCDRAFAKDLPGAIRSLRSIEAGGDDPLMVLGGIASRLRDLLRVRSLPERMPPAEVARAAGLRFDWQARRYQQQARNFSIEQLVVVHDRITEADRAMKSGAGADVVMPTLIAAIAAT
jgi:DNA polymerase-3 subunit delta